LDFGVERLLIAMSTEMELLNHTALLPLSMQSSPSTEAVAMLLFSVAFLSAGAMAEVELGLDVEAAVVLLISPAVLLRSIRLK